MFFNPTDKIKVPQISQIYTDLIFCSSRKKSVQICEICGTKNIRSGVNACRSSHPLRDDVRA